MQQFHSNFRARKRFGYELEFEENTEAKNAVCAIDIKSEETIAPATVGYMKVLWKNAGFRELGSDIIC